MGSKGKSCCCGPCYTRNGSSVGAAVCPTCCSCVPKNACISVYTQVSGCGGTSWESGVIFAGTQSTWCDISVQQYAGTLNDTFNLGNTGIDYTIEFSGGTGCFICFSSNQLGYSSGNKVCIDMGSGNVKNSGCSDMIYDFPVSLTGVKAGCDSGIIRLRPYDTIARSGLKEPTGCFMEKACITVYESGIPASGNSGVYSGTTCFSVSGSTSGWFIDMDDDPSKSVSIILDNYAPSGRTPPSLTPSDVSLRVTSYMGSGILQSGTFCPRMYAKWQNSDATASFTVPTYESGIIKIEGDIREVGRTSKTAVNNTKPCKGSCDCWCRCLCITYFDDKPPYDVERQTVCSESGKWEVSFASGDFGATIELICSGCDTRNPYLTITPSGSITSTSGIAPQSVICPDQLDIDAYPFDNIGAESGTASLYIECLKCDEQCDVEDLGCITPCCSGERTSRIPVILYGTIESSTDCPSLVGSVINFVDSDAILTGTCSQEWEGVLECEDGSDTFCLACFDNIGTYEWGLNPSDCQTAGGSFSNVGTQNSCDPLDVLFSAVGPLGACCTSGTIDIRITE